MWQLKDSDTKKNLVKICTNIREQNVEKVIKYILKQTKNMEQPPNQSKIADTIWLVRYLLNAKKDNIGLEASITGPNDKKWHKFAYQLIPTTQVFAKHIADATTDQYFITDTRDTILRRAFREQDNTVTFGIPNTNYWKTSFDKWYEITQDNMESFYLSCAIEIMAPSFRGFFASYLLDNTAKTLAREAKNAGGDLVNNTDLTNAHLDANNCLTYFENKLKEARFLGLSLNGCLPDMFDMNEVKQINGSDIYPHLPWKIIDDPTPHPEGQSAVGLSINTNWRYGAKTEPRNAEPDQTLFEKGSTSLIKGLLPYLFNYLHNNLIINTTAAPATFNPAAATYNAAAAPAVAAPVAGPGGYSFILARARGSYFKSNQNQNRPPCQITFDKLLADWHCFHINIANRLLESNPNNLKLISYPPRQTKLWSKISTHYFKGLTYLKDKSIPENFNFPIRNFMDQASKFNALLYSYYYLTKPNGFRTNLLHYYPLPSSEEKARILVFSDNTSAEINGYPGGLALDDPITPAAAPTAADADALRIAKKPKVKKGKTTPRKDYTEFVDKIPDSHSQIVSNKFTYQINRVDERKKIIPNSLEPAASIFYERLVINILKKLADGGINTPFQRIYKQILEKNKKFSISKSENLAKIEAWRILFKLTEDAIKNILMNQIDKVALSKTKKLLTNKSNKLDFIWFTKLETEIAEDYQINLSNVSLEIDDIIEDNIGSQWNINKYNYNILQNVYQNNKKDFLIYPEDYKSDSITETIYALSIEKDLVKLIFEGESATVANIYEQDNQNKLPIFSIIKNNYYPFFHYTEDLKLDYRSGEDKTYSNNIINYTKKEYLNHISQMYNQSINKSIKTFSKPFHQVISNLIKNNEDYGNNIPRHMKTSYHICFYLVIQYLTERLFDFEDFQDDFTDNSVVWNNNKLTELLSVIFPENQLNMSDLFENSISKIAQDKVTNLTSNNDLSASILSDSLKEKKAEFEKLKQKIDKKKNYINTMTDNSFKTDKLNKITLEETSNNDKITKLDQLINKLQPTVNNNRITEILNRLKSRQKHDLLEEYDDIIKRMNNNKTKNTSTNTFLQIWKLFFNNQPESPLGNLIPLYVLKKEYNLLNNNDEMNLEQLSTLIKLRPYYQRISSICREFFERPKYTDENKPLEFTFNLMQFLTKIYISNGIHNLMRYTILQYLIQTQPTTKLGDVLIILQNIFKQEYVWRGRRGTLDEILNNQVSKLLVQNIKNIHPDVNQEFNAKMISANDIISNVFG